jgi:hypothetical protein
MSVPNHSVQGGCILQTIIKTKQKYQVVSGELLKRGQQWVIDYVGILTFNKISVIGVKNNILKSENSNEE